MANPNFVPSFSSNEVFRNLDMTRCITDDLDTIETDLAGKAASDHTHTGYATSDHTHTGYAAENHTHTGYAAENHTHDGYAASSHTHTGYALQSEVDSKPEYKAVIAMIALGANNLITFSINGVTYAGEMGGIFSDWCDSDMNVDGYYIGADDCVYTSNGSKTVWYDDEREAIGDDTLVNAYPFILR